MRALLFEETMQKRSEFSGTLARNCPINGEDGARSDAGDG